MQLLRSFFQWRYRRFACIFLTAGALLGLALFLNRGAQAQSNALTLDTWQRHVIDDARPSRAVFIDGGDLNGDGLPDIATGGSWYANPGTPGGDWARREFGQPLNNLATLHDFNDDGKLDVLGNQGVGDEDNSAFSWAKNDGSGNFTLYNNFDATQGNFLQGISVNRYQAGGQLQVAVSWQDAAVGTQILTVPNDPVNETWTWAVASSRAFGEDLSSADIDDNGTIDLMLGSFWLENTGTGWRDRAVHDPLPGGPDRNELADINGDGRLDVVVGSSQEGIEGPLVWYEQPEVATARWTAHLISDTLIGGGMSLDVADMDNDGDYDVIVGEHDLVPADQPFLRLIIFENLDGHGAGWAPHVVHVGDEHHDGTRVIDIDLDGDLDILSIGWSHDRVLLYENKAIDTRNPQDPELIQLSTTGGALPTPSDSTEQTAALVLDVDKDGIKDFVIGSRGGSGPSVVWYRSTGVSWEKYVVENGVLPIEAGGAFYDIDGDGDLDLAFGGDYTSNAVWWWENPAPNFASGTAWTRRTIKASGVNMHHDMLFGDFDDDGRVELAFWNQRADQLILAETPDDPRSAGLWPLTPIYSYTGADHEGLAAADIDLDGQEDLVGGGRWFKHLGGSNYSVNLIDIIQTMGRTVVGQLIPGGRPEIVMAQGESDGPLKWYRWDGTNWIGADLLGVNVTNGHSLALADVNHDGHLDIFAAEMRLNGENEDAKMWFFYGDGAGNFRSEVLANGIGNHESRVADLDGDGDYDILGKPFNWATPRLDLWLNGGGDLPVNRWKRHVVDNARPWRAIFIVPGDVDGDRRPDIVAGAWWYRNPGQPGGTWVRNTIGEPLNNLAAVHDFDGDGALDVVGTGGYGPEVNNTFTWAHNDGTGNFTLYDNIDQGDGSFLQGTTVNRFSAGGPQEVILSWQNGEKGTQSLSVPADPFVEQWDWQRISPVSQGEGLDSADMDRDGDQDIMLGTKWLRNDPDGWTAFTAHNPATGDPDRVHLVDMDKDGDLDAVVGYGHDPNGKLAWYEQPDEITALWTEHLIANLVNPQSVDVADLDQDGDLDIVVGEHNLGSPNDSRLIIYQNEDGRGGAWITHLIHVGDEHHDGTQFVDIDGDGDLDIISTGWVQNRVLLYENLAIGGAAVNAPPEADAGPDQVLIDVDGDEQELVQLDGTGSNDDGAIVTYSWGLDGSEIASGETAEVFMPIGEHEVTLSVTDDEGISTVDVVEIAVRAREPSIQRQPQDRVVLMGTVAVFRVEATGVEPLDYQWQRDGEDIPGANGPEYRWANTMLADSGSALQVVVSNAYGSIVSEPASLRVLESRSDDFNSCVLNDALWTFIDPQAESAGASTLTVDGRRLLLSVPGATNHDVWTAGIGAPYVATPMNNTDFETVVKFDSSVNEGYQLQGVLILEDEENFVRFNVQHDGTGVWLLGIKFAAGTPTIVFNRPLPSGAAPFYLRVTRTGDLWQAAVSSDGDDWNDDSAFRLTHALNVTQVGIFAGNVGRDGPAPAMNMVVDYYVDTASPLTERDPQILAPDELDVVITPAETGNVSVATASGAACDETLELTAIAAQGWSFDRWVGSPIDGTQNPATGEFTTADQIEARFVEIEQFPLVVTIESNGEGVGGVVRREPDKAGYRAGDVVTLDAQPAAGWRFAGWAEALTGTDPTAQVEINGPVQVTAIFVQERFAMETETVGPGNGVIVVTPAQPTYAPGERVTLEAIAAANSFFDRWGGAASGTERVLELVMTDSLRVTARFGEDVFGLRTDTSGGGSVTVEPAQETYAPGSRVTLTAVPNEGWRFIGWDGHLAGDDNPATILMNASKTVRATFERAEPFEDEERIFLPAIRN